MKVSFLPAARADIIAQVEYLLEQFAFDAAERFPNSVLAAVDFVRSQPEAGAPSLAGLRSWAVPDFPRVRVYYRCPASDVLQVVRILHDARDIGATIGTP